jgi:hypothetical protein
MMLYTEIMKRIESDPDEQREIDEALSRAATPTHMPKGWVHAIDRFAEQEQPTEEFDSRELLTRLGQTAEFGVGFESHEWSAEQEAWAKGIEEEHAL